MLDISTSPGGERVQMKVSLNDCNSENTVILENLPDYERPILEMYIECETGCTQFHLMQAVEIPSSALLTMLQSKQRESNVNMYIYV